jgi:methionyl-tRNA formyltransferase
MSHPLKFVVLAGAGDPLTGYYLRAFFDRGVVPTAVIVDEKAVTAKDLAIFSERTEGRLESLPYSIASRIPFFFVANHNNSKTLEIIKDSGASFLVSAGTPRILKLPILMATPLGVLNCHPGLLPEFRGCSCVEWAIYLDKPVGVTVHRISEGIDEGPVLLWRQLDIVPGDRYADVRIKAYMGACDAIAEASLGLVRGRYSESDFAPQHEGKYYSPMDPDMLLLVKNKLAVGGYRSSPTLS